MSAWQYGSTAAVLIVFAGANGASAQDYEARSWAASCASCHGTDGRSESAVPALAGRSKADLVGVLMEFKSGKRKTATIMHQYAVGYSDQQLERIADHFSRQPR
jgi:cytochrome subunit of sulfide dehydrogenase